jgi:hypothetical protein
MRAFIHSIATIILLCGLCSCEYPEQGYYELVGLDADGRVQGSQMFIVEEYVDDTEMTTGFGVLLPALDGKSLVSIPLAATEGFESRGWELHTNVRQTGQGNLDLVITHIAERIKLQGSLQVAGQDSADEFHATLRDADSGTNIMFVGNAPRLPADFSKATVLQLRIHSAESFEAACGLTLDSPQVPRQPRDMQEVSQAGEDRRQAAEPGPDHGEVQPPARP